MKKKHPNVLGLDQATVTGFADGQGHHGIFDLREAGDSMGARLNYFRNTLNNMIQRWLVSKISFEYASYASLSGSVSDLHGALRGIILMVADTHNIPVVWYSPSTIKKYATGSGKAGAKGCDRRKARAESKLRMCQAATKEFGFSVTDDNLADALWIQRMGEVGFEIEKKAKPKRRKVKK